MLPLPERATRLGWLSGVQRQLLRPLLQDRHYLLELEQNMCIASLQDSQEYYCIDGVRLLLARSARPHLAQQVRELPVSLLRLYFAGHHHFDAIVRNTHHLALQQLLQLMRADPPTEASSEGTEGSNDATDFESAEARRDMRQFSRYLARILDAAFCSFERTLQLLAAEGSLPDFGLALALASDPYWAALPRPAGEDGTTGHLLWYACVWRCNVTLQLERLVKPWRSEAERDWLLYRMQLYRDTHLDLLSAMSLHRCFDDEALVARRLLQLYWPTCDRVCCAEELPDLAPYACDNLKTGTHLKARTSLAHKLGHILFIKTMNNICKDRNFFDIVVRDGEQDELVYDLVKAIARCVLLGNLPGARGQLSMLARVRCNVSFWPALADRVLEEEEILRLMPQNRNPFAMEQAKREKKRAKEQGRGTAPERVEQMLQTLRRKQERASYDKTCFKMWILKVPYFVASLFKEFVFHELERGRCMDELLSLDLKWTHYKQIVRIANGQCRQEVARQIGAPGTNGALEPIDWSVIEHVDKAPERDYEVKRGKIMEFHALTLRVAEKVMKRDFMGIIDVKATGTEEEASFQRQALAPVYREESDAASEKPTLHELHFLCWHMAQRLARGANGGILETRWFQALGMTQAGLTQLRQWLFRYHTYDIADDSLKAEIRAFRKRSMNDYLLMKTVFKLVNYYVRAVRLFFMPVAFCVAQCHALRTRQFALMPWETSPELMGVLYQCQGCMRFANAVVQPLDFAAQSNYSELVRRRAQIYSDLHPRARHPLINGLTYHNLVLTHQGKRTRVLEYYKTRVARIGQSNKTLGSCSRVARDTAEEQRQQEALEEEEQRRRRENISFLTVAYYDVRDGQPYCVRSRRQRVSEGVQQAHTTISNTVLHSLQRGTRIESTRFNAPIDINSSDELQQQQQQSDEADEESTGDEPRPIEEMDPQYESNRLLFNPSVQELRREGREYLQQWIGSSATFESPGCCRKARAADNNKKRVLRFVNEPLTRLYNCQQPLQRRDMLGVIQNGKVLCVECGVMTELTSFSMTSRGPVCMRHASAGFTLNHPVWQMDAQSVSHMNRARSHDGSDCSTGKQRRRPHPSDVVSSGDAAFARCARCLGEEPAVRVACYEPQELRLCKVQCCLQCYRKLRPLIAKHLVLTRAQVTM